MTSSMAVLSSSPATTASATSTFSVLRNSSTSFPPPSSISITGASRKPSRFIRCEVAFKSDSSTSIGGGDSSEHDDELKKKLEIVGSKVRVTAPIKFYHVPRVPEVEIDAGTEGIIKQYAGLWKGKRISANFPYKVEFQIEIEGRGNVKVLAHLRDDEFEII